MTTTTNNSTNYQIYLIGGAIRDVLLGLDINDFDYMVVGLNTDNILESIPKVLPPTNPQHPTYKIQVSYQDQPVELALARKETKIGVGYFGFKYEIDGVSLEQDIIRRDLTINTLALPVTIEQILDQQITKDYILAHQDQILDITGYGIDDIKQRVFRATSPKFIDDPIRVSRLAKFYVKFREFGFKIDESLVELMIKQFTLAEAQELFKPSLKLLNQNLQYSLEHGNLLDHLRVFAKFKIITLTEADEQEIIRFNAEYLQLNRLLSANTITDLNHDQGQSQDQNQDLNQDLNQVLNFTSMHNVSCKINDTSCDSNNNELDLLTSLFLQHLKNLDHQHKLPTLQSLSQLSKFKLQPDQTPSCFDFVVRHYDRQIIKQILADLKIKA